MSTTPELAKYLSIFGVDGFLRKHNIERNEEAEILGLATVSGVDTLFLGDPGTGKTWLIELMVNECLSDMELFSILMSKDMSADEVLGPRNVMAMRDGKIERLMDGFAPRANFAYWDEVFKSSPPLVNPMLDLMANRVLKVGGHVHDCSQLIAIFMSSNELPDREDLMAFRDRIGLTKFVEPVKTPEGRRAVTDIQLDFQAAGLNTAGVDPLTLSDVRAIRAQLRQIVVGDAVRDTMVEAQQRWFEAGHPPSQRRIGQMWKMAKARAWANGRTEVTADDLIISQHMAWNHPDHQKSAREAILDLVSVYTRKAARTREAMEPIVASMEALKTQLDAAGNSADMDDLLAEGFKFLQQLRRLRRETKDQVTEGKSAGQDTTMLESVLADINRYEAWANTALSGGEE